MSYAPYQRATLLIPSGPQAKNHLFVILTHLCSDGEHLLLSISTIDPARKHDTTCEFVGGDHPFITRASFVEYGKPYRKNGSHITQLVARQVYFPRVDLDPPHFARMCAGIGQSPFASPSTQKYFAANR